MTTTAIAEPVDLADAVQPSGGSHPLRTECPKCEKLFRAVALAGCRWSEDVGGYTVVAAMNCDHCEHVIVAEFPADARGHVTGRRIGVPALVRGAARQRYLINHPELKGVAQI